MKPDSEETLWNYYQQVNPTYLETASRDKVMLLAKVIKRHTRANDRMCEVGLGNGLMLQELSRCRNVIGVDLCEDAISYIRSKPGFANIALKRGNICKLSSICNNMDAVVTIDVIEHLTPEQLVEACHEVYNVLKSGGKWFINVPWNENLKYNEILCPHCHQTFHRVGHKQSFDEARLKEIMANSGFRVAFVRKIYPSNFVLPAPLMWCYRIIAMIYLKSSASMFAMVLKD